MRQRHIRNREEIMQECGRFLVQDPEGMKGHWLDLFPSCRELKLEIGSGKGRFLTRMALKYPETAFLACEGQYNVYPRILQKLGDLELPNMLLIADYITDPCAMFADGELNGIYLNFSDPWKERTAHRRLTYRKKLESYKRVCAPGSFLEFKTDNDELFEFSLGELAAAGLEPDIIEYDLHASGLSAENIMTEYEEKFTDQGIKIKYFRTVFT